MIDKIVENTDNHILYYLLGLSWCGIISLLFIARSYIGQYHEYKNKYIKICLENKGNNKAVVNTVESLTQEINILKSLISRLIFIIKGKPALLAREKLRFTFSIRANGKRVARVKKDNLKDTRPITVIGEPMVQISPNSYVKERELYDIFKRGSNTWTKDMENKIDELNKYNISL